MNCRGARHQMTVDQLSDAQKGAFGVHLRSCPACRQEWSAFQRLSAVLKEQVRRADVATLSPDFDARFWARLHRESDRTVLRRRWSWGGVAAACAAAAVWAFVVRGPAPSQRWAEPTFVSAGAGMFPVLSAAVDAGRREDQVRRADERSRRFLDSAL